MPELPEVDLMCEYLQRMHGGTIVCAQVFRGKYLKRGEQISSVIGKTVTGVQRRGKYLVIRLDEGLLLCHNAMSGFWDTKDDPWTFDYVEGKRIAGERDVRVTIDMTFADGRLRTFRFHDARLFGSLQYYPCYETSVVFDKMERLGPDAILTKYSLYDTWWCYEDLAGACYRSKKTIKDVLMNQHVVAGIGNIYATEGLWKARIRPDRPAQSLTAENIEEIFSCCRYVLDTSLAKKVNYKQFIKCYRENSCSMCETLIDMIKISGRSSYFCPNCQK
jgi:formamidopyrimidine-DNA glycosylase